MNTMTTKDGREISIMQFAGRAEAGAWLDATGNYGIFHDSVTSHGVIVVQFAEGKAWAFVSADELVLLPEW